MKNLIKKVTCQNLFLLLLFVGLIYILYFYNNGLKEGVIFTRYDRSNLFNKPWAKFCTPNPPPCQVNHPDYPEIAGSPMIGCWCNKQGQAPLLDASCPEETDYL